MAKSFRFAPKIQVGRKIRPFHGTQRRLAYERARSPIYGSAYNYQMAGLYEAYGQPQMGDLFNDIMGAVVPKWEQRPDWMKKIKIKPDPLKIAQTAAKVVPPKEMGRVVDQAAKYGVNLQYSTPAGNVPITGQMVSSGYQNLPIIASFAKGMSEIPTWAYVAGGLGVVLLVVTMVRK